MPRLESVEPEKERAIGQWTADPAGAVLAGSEEFGSPAFYREVERTRYEAYPWLLAYLTPERWRGQRMLEVGVGLGTDHLMLHRAGAEATGVDLTPASVEHTRRRLAFEGFEASVEVADAEHLPFADGEFDAVYSFGVLHHTPGMARTVQEILRILRPGGTAVVGLYNRHSYFHAWRLARHYLTGTWRRRTREQMRADFEHGDGMPLVLLSSRRELERMFSGFASVAVCGRHLPTNRVPAGLRPRLDRVLQPLEDRVGWYWIVEAAK